MKMKTFDHSPLLPWLRLYQLEANIESGDFLNIIIIVIIMMIIIISKLELKNPSSTNNFF
jgi:hypothetical protein